jgi:hypothetical protein
LNSRAYLGTKHCAANLASEAIGKPQKDEKVQKDGRGKRAYDLLFKEQMVALENRELRIHN